MSSPYASPEGRWGGCEKTRPLLLLLLPPVLSEDPTHWWVRETQRKGLAGSNLCNRRQGGEGGRETSPRSILAATNAAAANRPCTGWYRNCAINNRRLRGVHLKRVMQVHLPSLAVADRKKEPVADQRRRSTLHGRRNGRGLALHGTRVRRRSPGNSAETESLGSGIVAMHPGTMGDSPVSHLCHRRQATFEWFWKPSR